MSVVVAGAACEAAAVRAACEMTETQATWHALILVAL
jgi:hypothetical protein